MAMTRRGFFKAIFKLSAAAPAAVVVAKSSPSWIEAFLEWFQRKCRPLFRLPLIRRVFPEFNAKEFVSVQPMSKPSGLVFYADFMYKGKKWEPKYDCVSTEPTEVTNDWLDIKE